MSNIILNSLNLKQKKILSLIRSNKEISAADMSRITGFQRSSMAYILGILKKKGLVQITGQGNPTSHGGKPPTLWSLSNNAGFMIGFEVTPFHIRTTITDFSSRILYQDSQNGQDLLSEGNTKYLADFILGRIKTLQIDRDKIIGIVLALPGFINEETGNIFHYSESSIVELPLKEELNTYLDIPVTILNDTNAGAYGVKWFSLSPEEKNNIIFINYNEHYAGIGAGFIFNGILYTGDNGIAGEFMLETIKQDDLIQNIIKQHTTSLLRKGMTMENIIDLSNQNDSAAIDVVQQICLHISTELSRLVTLLNPSQIVIGGSLSSGGDKVIQLLTEMIEERCRRLYPKGIVIPQIQFSPFGIYSISMGATALLVDEIFNTVRKEPI